MPPLVLLFLLHSSYIQYTQHCKPLTSPYLAFSPLLSLFNTQALSTTVVLFIVSLSSSGSTLIPCSNWGADQPVTVVVCIPLPSWDHGDGGNNEGYIWMELRVVHTSSFFWRLYAYTQQYHTHYVVTMQMIATLYVNESSVYWFYKFSPLSSHLLIWCRPTFLHWFSTFFHLLVSIF